MPLYDFQCRACGAVFEIERPLGAGGKVKCRLCGSLRTDKMFSAAGIVFKGSGFYATDSKTGSNSASLPVDNAGGSGSAGPAGPETSGQADQPSQVKPDGPAKRQPDKPTKEKKPA